MSALQPSDPAVAVLLLPFKMFADELRPVARATLLSPSMIVALAYGLFAIAVFPVPPFVVARAFWPTA
ncbi:MAG: hypothetical protein LLG14_11040 [Nocardiaceae bacterium]|nr:hypothetical protein [Nocardiaceae bacterium]